MVFQMFEGLGDRMQHLTLCNVAEVNYLGSRREVDYWPGPGAVRSRHALVTLVNKNMVMSRSVFR